MKNITLSKTFHRALLLSALLIAAAAHAAEKVGVYDSRLVAYAHFMQPAQQAKLQQLVADGKAAKAAHEETRYREIEQQILAQQGQLHLQVFSTAPAPEALAALAEKLPAIEHEAGVTRLISKWDTAALQDVGPADRVDVTEQMLRGFTLDEKQRKTVDELAKKTPMPLAKAQKEVAAGKM